MNVIHDKKRWPASSIPNEAINNIMDGGGITLSATLTHHNGLGEKQIAAAKSIVWAVSDRGVPQHEAVHAYFRIVQQTQAHWTPLAHRRGRVDDVCHYRVGGLFIVQTQMP